MFKLKFCIKFLFPFASQVFLFIWFVSVFFFLLQYFSFRFVSLLYFSFCFIFCFRIFLIAFFPFCVFLFASIRLRIGFKIFLLHFLFNSYMKSTFSLQSETSETNPSVRFDENNFASVSLSFASNRKRTAHPTRECSTSLTNLALLMGKNVQGTPQQLRDELVHWPLRASTTGITRQPMSFPTCGSCPARAACPAVNIRASSTATRRQPVIAESTRGC
jgi:hypothetical protein